ncbi:hypothetical protein MVEN_01782200 [Mycena venus]|uniref:Uncharacterized protein n=1 Tax=Mycena venus TaxID=2733690 RepID=A0A8H6XLJ8_9AGAR|nr:hypothetical protein MVEN_01782200 [Mycena venus]
MTPVPKLPPVEPVISPRVDIDIDFDPGGLVSLSFLKTDSIAGPSSLTGAASAIAESANASKSADTLPTDEASDEEDDDDLSETSEDVVSGLGGIGCTRRSPLCRMHISHAFPEASHFLKLPESDGLPQSTPFPRKAAPSPIKIPNASLHGPRVQLVRSSTTQSRPESTFSFDGVSAVSGTTIARVDRRFVHLVQRQVVEI